MPQAALRFTIDINVASDALFGVSVLPSSMKKTELLCLHISYSDKLIVNCKFYLIERDDYLYY